MAKIASFHKHDEADDITVYIAMEAVERISVKEDGETLTAF
jgi:hypothetical protein